MAVPKTMDNDVRNTEYCIGFSTALTRAMAAIERQETTVSSHERIGVFRVFGRDAGYTALYAAHVTSARCCIPEYKVNVEKLVEMLVEEKGRNPLNYSVVILSEGAEWEGYQVKSYGEPDAFGHRKKMSVAADLGVHLRDALQRVHRGLHEHRHQAQLDAVAGHERVLHALAQVQERGQVDLVERGQQRRLLLGADEALGDAAAHQRHGHDLVAAVVGRGGGRRGMRRGRR